MEDLCKPVELAEVKEALFDMKPWKAPGVDGLQAGFYQKKWETVGPSVYEEVLRVFSGGKLDARMNATLISLIPKMLLS